MKKLIILILITNVVLHVQSQQTHTDLSFYKDKCEFYKDVSSDSLSKYALAGMAIAEKEKSEAILTTFYRFAAISCFQKKDYDDASSYFAKALELATKREDKNEEPAIYLAMGYMYGTQSNFKLSIEYSLKALPLFEAIDNHDKAMETLVNIGSAYRRSGNTEMAIGYFTRAKELTEGSDNAFLNSLVFFELGTVVTDMVTKIEYELKALEYARIAGNKGMENLANQALAVLYMSDSVKDFDKALIHAGECHRIAVEQGSKYYIFSALSMISNIYIKQRNYKASEAAALEAWAIDSTNLGEGRTVARNIAIANIYLGNADKAIDFFDKYETLTSQYTDESYHKEMVEMSTKYETEKKEIRITALEGERKLYIILGITIGTALLFGIGLLFYRHRSVTQKNKIAEQQINQLEQEKEIIATRSALDAEKAEREIIARDLHDGVGAMLSVVKNNMDIMKSYSLIENKEVNYFNNALDVLDKSISELRRVAHHIMPAMLIEKGLPVALNDFCRSVPEAEFHFADPDRRFDAEKELVLYRCAYELVNNAIRHAKASHIDVHLNMDENMVYLSVVDNGCGFDPQTVSPGMGINNMRTRLSAFGGRIDIYSEEGKGTEINIEMDL